MRRSRVHDLLLSPHRGSGTSANDAATTTPSGSISSPSNGQSEAAGRSSTVAPSTSLPLLSESSLPTRSLSASRNTPIPLSPGDSAHQLEFTVITSKGQVQVTVLDNVNATALLAAASVVVGDHVELVQAKTLSGGPIFGHESVASVHRKDHPYFQMKCRMFQSRLNEHSRLLLLLFYLPRVHPFRLWMMTPKRSWLRFRMCRRQV
ncbi:hypothetical protein DFS34DRAFT_102750 [Phlyctochytrium arcticum]|nr:hypothetical protein DFS34DRAFT_102750 [Phlyctochytrium arcticum]